MKAKASLAALAMLGLSAAGCSRHDQQPLPDNINDMNTTDETVNMAPPPEATPLPEPTQATVNTAEALPPAAPVTPDEQTLDDASATGMTARATRGGDTPTDADTSAPAATNQQ